MGRLISMRMQIISQNAMIHNTHNGDGCFRDGERGGLEGVVWIGNSQSLEREK